MNQFSPIAPAVRASDGHALLRSRRSVRQYRADPPPADQLERIFISAAQAPSAHNRQPWRYLVVTDDTLKVRLADVMGARLAADRRRDGDADEAIHADVLRSRARIVGAPVAILVALTVADMDRYPDEARNRAEFLMAAQSTAMATQNLLLAAHAEGLGACWLCAPLFCPADVAEALSLPEDWIPQGLITLGYPERTGKLRPRKPLAEFVRYARPGS